MRSHSFRFKWSSYSRNKIQVANSSEVKYLDNSGELEPKKSWAYSADILPFANDGSFWGAVSAPVKLSEVLSMSFKDYLSQNCQRIKDNISRARDKSNDLTKEARLDLFCKAKKYSVQIVGLGHTEGIDVLKDLYGNGLKVGAKKLCASDKESFSFWDSVGRKLTYAEGYKAGYTNSASTMLDTRAATFINMSGKAHYDNQKVHDACTNANIFIENFESVILGGYISEPVVDIYRDGLVRCITGQSDEMFTE